MLEYIDHIESPTAPTLVLLHGYGSNKEDLFGLQPYFKGYNLVCFQAPIAMGMGESQIPVFQSHGTEDQVIPFDWAQATSKLLATNPNYNFYEYAMGHNLNMPCIAKLQEFLKNSRD